MLKKGMFSKLLLVLVIISFAVCIQVPVMAQEETVQDQLAEAKAAIDDQVWVIEQMTDNFFETTAELMEEINSLKAANDEKGGTITQMTENFFNATGNLNAQIGPLEDQIVALEADVAKLVGNFFKVTGELRGQIDQIGPLESEIVALQADIELIEERFFEARTALWNREAEVVALQGYVDQITDNYSTVTNDLMAQTKSLKGELAALKNAEGENLATIKKLKTQRLWLGFGFLVASYYAISLCSQ